MAQEQKDPEKTESEKKHTSDDGKSPVVLTPSSPYYLGSSDNPGTPLVAALLNDDNY